MVDKQLLTDYALCFASVDLRSFWYAPMGRHLVKNTPVVVVWVAD